MVGFIELTASPINWATLEGQRLRSGLDSEELRIAIPVAGDAAQVCETMHSCGRFWLKNVGGTLARLNKSLTGMSQINPIPSFMQAQKPYKRLDFQEGVC